MTGARGVPDAAAWVRTLPRGARVDWDELEAHVLRDHPAALRALGPAGSGVLVARRRVGFLLGAGIAVATLIAVPVLAAPVLGLAVLAGDPLGIDDVDGRVAVPVAGASLLVAAVVQLVLLARIARGRPDSGGIGAATAVLATLIAVGTALVGARQDVPGWPAWTASAVGVAVLGGVVARASRRASRRPAPTGDVDVRGTGSGERSAPSRLDRERRLDAALAALPEAERDRLLDDRRRAVEWLRLQGVVSPETAARAVRAPLGRSSASV
ncbi:hypothetical protein [Agromyces tropicus]|uniref:hypothetical protein n=1 Tax=Agromyces tropicus TaxID=555371 RepID=UPI0031D9B7E6